MKQANCTKYPIEDLIPQRIPMICVDQLLYIDENSATSTFLIGLDFLFINEGKITAAGLMENAAQTAAARSGFIHQSLNENPILGFISTFKNIEILEYPNISDQLTTEVTIERSVFNMWFYDINTFVDTNLVMRGKMGIFLESLNTKK